MSAVKGLISYRPGYKYQLAAPYVVVLPEVAGFDHDHEFFKLKPDGTLLIRCGYAWDGPSGPTIDTANFMRGSLVHDVLYQLMRYGSLPQYLRKDADAILRRLCIEDGMSKLRAWWCWRGVGDFAAFAARRKNDDVRSAP